MASSSRPRLTIPAVLTVSALGLSLGCPAGDDGDTGNDTGTEGPGTTQGTTEGPGTTQGTTEAATAGQTSDGTTTSGTTAATGLDTGSTAATAIGTDSTTGEPEPLPDCASFEDEPSCVAEPLCVYNVEFGCVIACELLDDEATCESTMFCDWFDGFCYSPK